MRAASCAARAAHPASCGTNRIGRRSIMQYELNEKGRPEDRPKDTIECGRLRRFQIDRLGTASIGFGVEANALAFVERPPSSALDGGDVHEHILATAFRRDESKALRGVEEFDRSGLLRHAIQVLMYAGGFTRATCSGVVRGNA